MDKMASILRKADELGIRKENGLRVAAEVRGRDAENYLNNEKETRNILEKNS